MDGLRNRVEPFAALILALGNLHILYCTEKQSLCWLYFTNYSEKQSLCWLYVTNCSEKQSLCWLYVTNCSEKRSTLLAVCYELYQKAQYFAGCMLPTVPKSAVPACCTVLYVADCTEKRSTLPAVHYCMLLTVLKSAVPCLLYSTVLCWLYRKTQYFACCVLLTVLDYTEQNKKLILPLQKIHLNFVNQKICLIVQYLAGYLLLTVLDCTVQNKITKFKHIHSMLTNK